MGVRRDCEKGKGKGGMYIKFISFSPETLKVYFYRNREINSFCLYFTTTLPTLLLLCPNPLRWIINEKETTINNPLYGGSSRSKSRSSRAVSNGIQYKPHVLELIIFLFVGPLLLEDGFSFCLSTYLPRERINWKFLYGLIFFSTQNKENVQGAEKRNSYSFDHIHTSSSGGKRKREIKGRIEREE